MIAERHYLFLTCLVSSVFLFVSINTQLISQIQVNVHESDLDHCVFNNQTEGFNHYNVCRALVGVDKHTFCPFIRPNCRRLARNCKEIIQYGYTKSGIYEIQPAGIQKPIFVLCDMDTVGGGWTHIQKRFDGSVDFYRDWRNYKFGFGNLKGEFWLGLENIHRLTGSESNELLIELTDRDGTFYGRYQHFVIGSEFEGYPLKVASGFSGDIKEGFGFHLGQKFTTFDLDQDQWKEDGCANYSMGAWWYNNCYSSNLNGKYRNMPHTDEIRRRGMNWDPFTESKKIFLSGSRMLVRPT